MGKIFNHKFLLNCCNFMFLICGGFLIFGGFYLFSDTKRVLLSRLLASTSEQLNNLPQPLFYYISLGLAVAGSIAVLASIIGFWASCLNTYCFLSFYFLSVVILLLAESVVCLAITLWPHCLGIGLDEAKMIKALQENYGIPGREQFTIAMDLAQTRFGCCGISSELNYDISIWRLHGYGPKEWVVPPTCCILENVHQPLSYLDPRPVNETQCQMLTHGIDNSKYRHTKPCLETLDIWYRDQYVIFLGASLVIAIVEFFVLLSIILNCTKISKRSCKVDNFLEMRTRAKSNQTLVDNIYGPDIVDSRSSPLSGATFGHQIPSEFKEVYIQPQDLIKNRHNTTFKPGRSHYHISTRSYLV